MSANTSSYPWSTEAGVAIMTSRRYVVCAVLVLAFAAVSVAEEAQIAAGEPDPRSLLVPTTMEPASRETQPENWTLRPVRDLFLYARRSLASSMYLPC